jgi:pimeloyl-ACP methyl ester carboxylesterase
MWSSEELVALCSADGEFMLVARHWSGGVRVVIDDVVTGFRVVGGTPQTGVPDFGPGVIELSGSSERWKPMLEPVPPRFANDVVPMLGRGVDKRSDEVLWWQYLPAIQRMIELLRPTSDVEGGGRPENRQPGDFDDVVGRYVHLQIGGERHRIYFEESGSGIPILLQHTAGSHGVQWRHLMECRAVTSRFRLIAYDLPHHGKSIPPDGRAWWTERYRLTGSQLRSHPLALAEALDLDRPVFMGCSVGGLLALDLALHHPDEFRAVIALEGALHIGGDLDEIAAFWHPQVSSETKARVMQGLMSPTSPIARRKETAHAYAGGWPPAFLGDLWYYIAEFDIRERAGEIDTERVAVHILSGEYDYSGTVECGRQAHEAITGSTFTEMRGLGHFPMSEDPERFLEYLLPVLGQIDANGPRGRAAASRTTSTAQSKEIP